MQKLDLRLPHPPALPAFLPTANEHHGDHAHKPTLATGAPIRNVTSPVPARHGTEPISGDEQQDRHARGGEGNKRYDAIVKQNLRPGQVVQSGFKDLVPLSQRIDVKDKDRALGLSVLRKRR